MKSVFIFLLDSLVYVASLIGIYYLLLCIPFIWLSIIISVLILLFCFAMILPMIVNMTIGFFSGIFMIILGNEKEVKTHISTINRIYFVGMLTTLALIWILCPKYNLSNIFTCVSSTILSFMVWGIKINGVNDLYKSSHNM